MNEAQEHQKAVWQKSQYANLIRYVPSGIFYARFRVRGKLVRKALKTDRISVAKLRLADLEKAERQAAANQTAVTRGKITFGDALKTFRQRIAADANLKPRTKSYYGERITALLKSWPGLERLDVRKISRADCTAWAAWFSPISSPNAFNHTASVLKNILEVGVELGTIYDNPARFIKWVKEKRKKLTLPEPNQFEQFIKEIETSGGGFAKSCANLARFLAFGGFRKTEASHITWAHCNFEKGEIIVHGDPLTGTKNSEVRRVPMIPEMRSLLERMRGERKSDSPETPVMRVRECQKAMDRAARLVGMKRITHHDLRHLFATRCIESGVDVPTVSRWLGHKDGEALAMKVYGHLRDQHSVEMSQRVSFSQPTTEKMVRLHQETAA